MPNFLRYAFGSTLTLSIAALHSLGAQDVTVRGVVRRSQNGDPVARAAVAIDSRAAGAFTDAEGRFALTRVQPGQHRLFVRLLGYRPDTMLIDAREGMAGLEITLEAQSVQLSDVVVFAPSRVPERLVEAPAATGVVDQETIDRTGITDQVPLAVGHFPGVDLAPNDLHDFNLNARGFNRSLTRRVLVLQDGRDLAIAFLGSQEWAALSVPLEDISRIEMVRGPGSALYGANAFSGVLSITTPAPREIVGSKLTMEGGELESRGVGFRRAALFGGGRFGYRLNLGYNSSRNWAQSRTGPQDLAREYAGAVDASRHAVIAPAPGFELMPLQGQFAAGVGQSATGTPDPETTARGTLRLDYYARDGSIATLEGGSAWADNHVLMGPAGRAQVAGVTRPWARMAWNSDRSSVSAWYSARESRQPNYLLAAAYPSEETSRIMHLEAQTNRSFWNYKGRVVLGGSARDSYMDSRRTMVDSANDGRHYGYYSLFGQVDLYPLPKLRLVVAARYDDGTLFKRQVSPKAALVLSPTEQHAFRVSVNRAFQTPNMLDYFVDLPAGPPVDFSGLEGALRASPLGSALTRVPNGSLFTNSSAVPLLVKGNPEVDVEHVTSYEAGYKGQLSPRVFTTVDLYVARLSQFVTDVLPGVNPGYARWNAPAEVPSESQSAVAQAVRDALVGAGQPGAAAGLTRLPGGATAIVLSIGNAGRVTERGVEVGLTTRLSDAVELDGTYSLFTYTLAEGSLAAGQLLLPNTARNRGGFGATWRGRRGDARASATWVAGFDWASGIFVGYVPSSFTVDLTGGWQLGRGTRLQFAATNLLDQQRYHVYGGSVIGRRVLAGLRVQW